MPVLIPAPTTLGLFSPAIGPWFDVNTVNLGVPAADLSVALPNLTAVALPPAAGTLALQGHRQRRGAAAGQPGRDGTPTTPVLRDGQPAWHAPGAARDYLARLGGNTSYIFHPEETMADNIAFLVSGRKVPNPGLLKRIQAVLLGEAKPQ